MSAEAPPPPEPPSGNGATAARGYDRVPPHSLEAEVSVLGAALLSRTAAGEALEVLSGDDFYRNAHRTVYEAIQTLFAQGEPVDTVTVTDWLARRDRLDEVGGAAALLDLTVAVPTAANAAHYAGIVREKALLRRLIDAGTQVARLGYEATEDATTVIDRAESLVYEVSQTGSTNDYAQLKELLNESFEQIEQLAEHGSEVTGLPTGFDDLDRLTAGLQPQNLIIVAARPAMGKCVGSCRVNYLKTGEWLPIDELVSRGREGEPIQVAAVDERGHLVAAEVEEFHYNGVRPVFEIRTRSGRSIRATDNHPFLTWQGWRELRDIEPRGIIAVPRELPFFGGERLADAEVKMLAYLLGDGCVRGKAPMLTTDSEVIEEEVRVCAAAFGARITTVAKSGTTARELRFSRVIDHTAPGRPSRLPDHYLQRWLEELGVAGHGSHDKFVPGVVFTLPREQVAVFLSRLFATDGSAWVTEKHGYFGISYCSVSERLIRDVQHLLLRFGILSRIRERQVKYLDGTNRAFELEIRDAANVRAFLIEIGIFSKEEQCEKALDYVDKRGDEHSNTDLLPVEVWDLILAEKGERSWADVSEATGRPRNHNWHVGKRRPSRWLVAELADALDSQRLRDVATSDVLWDEVVSIEPAGEEPVYDLTVPGLHNFVADDLIVHNSSLCLNLSQFVSVEARKPSIIFSLEMSKLEIVNRLLSSEAKIDSSKLRTGRLEDTDWRKLGDALGKLSEAPLFIDDTPSISLMEIRAKCRRLKQKHGLDLVIVDYLQLMQSHRRVDSRQQEVAEISRGLKMLAKELDVPVIALSQLSRQPEARTDKRPQLADLRESGCLTRDTRLFRADNGLPVTFGELVDRGLRDVPVWATDARGQLVAGRLTHAFPSGTKRAYRVLLRSGLEVEATGNHPFRTVDGWRPLDELAPGSRVAAARALPEPADPRHVDPDELVLLAHLTGEGALVSRQTVRYTSADEANLEAVEKSAWKRFGVRARRVADSRSTGTTQLCPPAADRLAPGRRDPIAAWLDELGCRDRGSLQTRLPPVVFGLSDEQVRRFLHHRWATGGHLEVRRPERAGSPVSLCYATSSHGPARDLQLLLLRLGLHATIRPTSRRGGRPAYQVRIDGAAQQRRFLTEVGVHGALGDLVEPALAALDGLRSEPDLVLPHAAWRTRPERSATGPDEQTLRTRTTEDLRWDEIVDIEPIGEREVYDATVAEHHNFVAEGLVLHNSIEQDADIVGFIYRDEIYDDQSPDRGIAELIIAKHRNGRTGVVRLAFLDHLTKFANLARGTSGGTGASGGAGGTMPPV